MQPPNHFPAIRRRMLLPLLLLAAGLSARGAVTPDAMPLPDVPAAVAGATRAKYVFLFIGDGMGANQRLLAELTLNGAKPPAPPAYRKLLMNRLPVTGLVNTHSADSWITDSAAAGTAIACGKKTANYVIAMDAAGKVPFDSLADAAQARGMRVGLATTAPLNDATPAVFYAHASNRSKLADIAKQAAASSIAFFGGRFKECDDKECLKEFRGAWFRPEKTEADRTQPYSVDRSGGDTPPLADITAAGIRALDNANGFFFMVEGGKIDWACHSNDAAGTAGDVLALDQAVALAVEFYGKHPAETLILVTADHETGGLTLGRAETGYSIHPKFIAGQKASAVGLTKKVQGWRAAKKSFPEALTALRSEWLDPGALAADETKALTKTYNEGQSAGEPGKESGLDPFAVACIKLAARRAGITWGSGNHTAAPVPVTAIGAGQNQFTGWMDNTELSAKIRALLAG